MPTHPGHQEGDELAWRMEGTSQEVSDILAEFARELRSGDVNVWKGQRELHLHPGGRLELRVIAAELTNREALTLELAWRPS
jgi:amphi-Trp domain-containing protein